MPKAIYTMINSKYYKINQDTSVPKKLCEFPSENHTQSSFDERLKQATYNVYISTMEKTCIKSNRAKYYEMINHLKDKLITEIDTVQNTFRVAIDYTICNSSCELDHSVAIKPLSPSDAAIILGVATNNESVYRRVKTFAQEIDFALSNPLPLGIMSTASSSYSFKINDITIYQDLSPISDTLHNSIYNKGCCCKSTTVSDSLSKYAAIFSTSALGIEIQQLSISFIPRKIIVNLYMCLAGLIEAYDENEVINILIENIENKYNPDTDPDDPDAGDDGDDDGTIPDADKYPDADGDETPNSDGWYDYYEKCLSTNPKALLVVEDLISDAMYDSNKMIRKKKVIKDIPDVAVGDYVRYVEAVIHSDEHGNGNTDAEDADNNTSSSSQSDNQSQDSSSSDSLDPPSSSDNSSSGNDDVEVIDIGDLFADN